MTRREGNREKAEITCLLENGRDCIEIKSLSREIRVNWSLSITLRVSFGFLILYLQQLNRKASQVTISHIKSD